MRIRTSKTRRFVGVTLVSAIPLVAVALASATAWLPSGADWTRVDASDGSDGERFGDAVALDGTRMVVGARLHGISGRPGAAYLYERFGDDPGSWVETAKLLADDPGLYDWFGGAVAIDGDTVLVGSGAHDHGAEDTGAAYVFERDGAGAWIQTRELIASDAEPFALFGRVVALSGDLAVVGAPFADGGGLDRGAVYVFERDAGGAGTWGEVARLSASDAADVDLFGWAVDVDDPTVVVGSHQDDDDGSASGSVYVFDRGPDGWVESAKLTASDAMPSALFGEQVALSGRTLVVGAQRGDTEQVNTGAAYVFERDPDENDVWVESAKLAAGGAAPGPVGFGQSVAIDRNTALVGATIDADIGAVHVYERHSPSAGAWGQVARLTPEGGSAGDAFGSSVAISRGRLSIGASQEDNRGAAYVVDYTAPVCGDAVREFFEECDDGNLDAGDGCDAECRSECRDDDADGYYAGVGPDCATGAPLDCDDGNQAAWAPPGEDRALELDPDRMTLRWSPPEEPGGALVHQLLRAGPPDGFASAVPIEADGPLHASDPESPPYRTGWFYLVRARNACPSGCGTLGFASDGSERDAPECPVP